VNSSGARLQKCKQKQLAGIFEFFEIFPQQKILAKMCEHIIFNLVINLVYFSSLNFRVEIVEKILFHFQKSKPVSKILLMSSKEVDGR